MPKIRKVLLIFLGAILLFMVGSYIYVLYIAPKQIPAQVRDLNEITSTACTERSGRVVVVNSSTKQFCASDETILAVVNNLYSPVNFRGNFTICCKK